MKHNIDGTVSKATFLRDYGREIIESRAVMFIGAGMSKPAGFVDWKQLLKEIAEDLELDITVEHDLVSIAQFHTNKTGNRSKINDLLLDEFTKGCSLTENHILIATLPLETIWTTNYDQLLESAFKQVGKKPEVKHSPTQLSQRTRGSDVTIFKMHGDCTMPSEAVLTKSDYEEYSIKRQLFSEKLQGDLVDQTFLFLGFSFSDPNIDYILSRVRVLMAANKRTHYCIMRMPPMPEGLAGTEKANFEYEIRKLELRIMDLKRYGIQTVLISEYPEITEILQILNVKANSQNVFISGSARDFSPLGQQTIEDFCRQLPKVLIDNDFNIVSGFGLGIGGYITMSSIESVYSKPNQSLQSRVLLRPFPQEIPANSTRQEVWSRYRHDMISQSGHVVFICGNKLDPETDEVVHAQGVREEFEIAKSLSKTLIPIGATGSITRTLWEEVVNDLDTYFPNANVKEEFDILGNESSSVAELVSATISIIKKSKI